MRRLLAIAVPAVLLLGMPASAPAKGIMGATVCGADGCREIPNPDHRLLEGGAPADPPAQPEPFVRVSIHVGVPDHVEPVRLLFLPRSALVLADDGTTWMAPLARGELQAIARRVTPLAASKLAAAISAAGGATARSGGSLPPEVFRATADPAAAGSGAPATAGADSFDAWWLAVPGVVIALAAGAVLARRRRRDPRRAPAGAPG